MRVAQERLSILERKAERIDDIAISLDSFLRSAHNNRFLLSDEFELIDEFILYGEYILIFLGEKIDKIMMEAREIEEFIAFGRRLLKVGVRGEHDDAPVAESEMRSKRNGLGDAEPNDSWLSDVMRHAAEQGAKSSQERRILYVSRPFNIDD